MFEADIMVSCRKCGSKTPAAQMKMDLDEKMMVCPNCLKLKKNVEISRKIVSEPAKEPVIEEKMVPESSSSSKIKHQCQSCGYAFNVNVETKTPKLCPYCGKPIYI